MRYAEYTPKPPKVRKIDHARSGVTKKERTDLERQYHQLHPMQLAFAFPDKFNYEDRYAK